MVQRGQYPVVRPGPDAGPRLDWENQATLLILQASQGLIGPEIIGMSVEAKSDEIVIHVCLQRDNEAVLGDLDDLLSEFNAIEGGIIEPQVRVTIARHIGAIRVGRVTTTAESS